MDNKEILKQNNTRLSENNIDLTSILNTINDLPENVEIKLQEKTVTPTIEQQEVVADEGYTGLSKVIVEEIAENNVEITPSSEAQNFDGIYTNVTVAGDEDLKAENIKEGTSIFGIEGSLKASTSSAKITDASYLFYNGARLDNLENLLELCDRVTRTYNMFYGCTQLTELDLSNFNTSNVTSMYGMFGGCKNITSLNVSSFNTSNVTSMEGMFDNCSKITSLDLSNFNTSNVTSMRKMFYECRNITSLNVSSFNTSNVTKMDGMFQLCDRVTELDLRNFDTSNVTSMEGIFTNCGFLTKLNLSSFDMSKVVGVSNFTFYTRKLQEIQSFKNLGKGYTAKSNNYSSYTLDLSSCNQLTYESLIDIITNGLYDLNLTYDVANGGTLYTQKLVLGNTNKAKLTADEIQLATSKGWTVS